MLYDSPSSLKVVELREELSKRNLPTKGKKDELISRLTEALEAEKQAQQEAEAANNEAPAEQDPAAEQMETAELSTVEPIEDPKESSDMQLEEGSTDAPTEQTKEQSVEVLAEKTIEQSVEVLAEKTTEQSVQVSVEETIERSVETVNEQVIEQSINSADEQKEKLPSLTTESVVEEQIEKSTTEVMEEPQQQKDAVISEDKPEESPKLADNNKRKRSPEAADTHEDKRTKVSDNEEAGAAALYVKGFIRPLIIRHVQELFSKYGTVKRFWMDMIKTHCYVIYDSQTEARKAFDNVNGIVFPAETGRELTAGYLTQEQAEKLIEYEQNAADKRIKIDWESYISKMKAGESLDLSPSTETTRKPRTIGIGQVARQLAQAAEPVVAQNAREVHIEERQERPSRDLSLDELFKKTKSLPHLYYLPNTDKEAKIIMEKLQQIK